MVFQIHKKGLRVLGISESFVKGESYKAVLAGVVMRGDFQIDGFGFSKITVGGMDATEGILEIYRKIDRQDINAILLNGCVISLFNIVELNIIHEYTAIPTVCVSYRESKGLEGYLKEKPGAKERLEAYASLGARSDLILDTKHRIFVRYFGIEELKIVKRLLDKFTIQGAVPEPLRVARLLARSIQKEQIF